MALVSGGRLGPYEILSPLGAGGMGEVYRARDTKLDREVAIKILPELFAADSERVVRFTREAKTLAALNHLHIAQIYGLEESNGLSALVMELVEGPTLADRIALGPLPIDEALPIAKQIAEALEAAHEQGIIHRDLKPANIKVREDGTVKVLDFGLAKAIEGAGEAGGAGRAGGVAHEFTASPTITSPAAMTHRGVILGTAAYMAPEQARGKAVDKRADIWAFGCVLFEMLAGTRAFPGEEITDVLAAVVKTEPDWNALPHEMPWRVRNLLRRCLTKDAKERLHDIADARLEINDTLTAPTELQQVATSSRRAAGRRRLAWAAAGVLFLILLGGLTLALRNVSRPADSSTPLWVSLPAPERDFGPSPAPAVSPDGRTIAFAAPDKSGQSVLWIRPLDTPTARALPGTDGADAPFFSPDGRSLGFFAGGKLERVVGLRIGEGDRGGRRGDVVAEREKCSNRVCSKKLVLSDRQEDRAVRTCSTNDDRLTLGLFEDFVQVPFGFCHVDGLHRIDLRSTPPLRSFRDGREA